MFELDTTGDNHRRSSCLFAIERAKINCTVTNASGRYCTVTNANDAALEKAGGNIDPEQTIREIRKSVGDLAGDAKQFDDLIMMCLEYRG